MWRHCTRTYTVCRRARWRRLVLGALRIVWYCGANRKWRKQIYARKRITERSSERTNQRYIVYSVCRRVNFFVFCFCFYFSSSHSHFGTNVLPPPHYQIGSHSQSHTHTTRSVWMERIRMYNDKQTMKKRPETKERRAENEEKKRNINYVRRVHMVFNGCLRLGTVSSSFDMCEIYYLFHRPILILCQTNKWTRTRARARITTSADLMTANNDDDNTTATAIIGSKYLNWKWNRNRHRWPGAPKLCKKCNRKLCERWFSSHLLITSAGGADSPGSIDFGWHFLN